MSWEGLRSSWAGLRARGQEEGEDEVKNQSPKGIKWSAVPWPCSTVFFLSFLFSYLNGSRAVAPVGDEVLWNGEIFHPSVCVSVCLS